MSLTSGLTVGTVCTHRLSSIRGGSRSSRCMNTTPRNLPVGGLYGAWQTKTWLAMLGVQSGLRISASASATVAVGPRITISGVMSPPAVASSYESRRVTTSASSSSIAARIAAALVRWHLAEQVGEVVVLHLVEHADQAVEVEVLDEPQLFGLGELLEHVGESLVVHRLGELAALRHGEGAHDGGDIGRMHVAQASGLGDHRAGRFEQARQFVVIDEAVARAAAQRAALGEADLGDLPPAGPTVGGGT